MSACAWCRDNVAVPGHPFGYCEVCADLYRPVVDGYRACRAGCGEFTRTPDVAGRCRRCAVAESTPPAPVQR